jgi:hypothetical protein
MYELDKVYRKTLEELATNIQNSEILANYLEEEEEEYFNQLKDLFEPQLAEIYTKVATENPLQLISLELILTNENFEGLFLPKILGYTVLRGEVDQNFRFFRPQEQFKTILLAICNSANFDILKKRIGQTIQIGFALSSDIWITNLINEVTNKKVRTYLQSQKMDHLRDKDDRKKAFLKYSSQFKLENFMTAEFPENEDELNLGYTALKRFLLYRVSIHADHSSILKPLIECVSHSGLNGSDAHKEITVLASLFFDFSKEDTNTLKQVLNGYRNNNDFADFFFPLLLELYESDLISIKPEDDLRISALLDRSKKDDVLEYFDLMEIIHKKGYLLTETQDAIRVFIMKHDGLSIINECIRKTIFEYFNRLISNLELEDYPSLFELSRQFPVFMKIFLNQQFSNSLKDKCMDYVHNLLAFYTDKRGKDYQDIKKFVSTTFLELDFIKEKEIQDLFKTKKK